MSELDESSMRLQLAELRSKLQAIASRDVYRSMAVELHLLAGHAPSEIQLALDLTVPEYRLARARLREALRT